MPRACQFAFSCCGWVLKVMYLKSIISLRRFKSCRQHSHFFENSHGVVQRAFHLHSYVLIWQTWSLQPHGGPHKNLTVILKTVFQDYVIMGRNSAQDSLHVSVAWRKNMYTYMSANGLNKVKKRVYKASMQNPSPVQVVCQPPTVAVTPHPLLTQLQEMFPGCSAYPVTCSSLLVETIFLTDKNRLNKKDQSGEKIHLGVTLNPSRNSIFNSFSSTGVAEYEAKVVLKTLQKLADDNL